MIKSVRGMTIFSKAANSSAAPTRKAAKTRGLTNPSQGATIARESTLPPVAAWTDPSVPRCFRPLPRTLALPPRETRPNVRTHTKPQP